MLSLSSAILGLALFVAPTFAATGYTLFGGADYVSPGNASSRAVELVSNSTDLYSGINFNVPSGATLGNLTGLSTDYKITVGDCVGGSPRFSLNYDNNPDTNIFVYIGPTPNFTGCTLNTWQNTGNFIGASDLRYDTSQMGGTFYDTYANAVSLTSSHVLTGISLVLDGAWKMNQTVLIDNTNVNSTIYDYELPTYTVTIAKYLDSAQASAALTGGASYPMVSSWNAINIGAGSGSYSLGPTGFNNPNPYQATTSQMTQGASYSTSEVTGGSSNILPIGAACQLGKYRLVGYSTGDTLAAAAASTPVSATPSFTNLASNQYVIVWNESCTAPTNKDQCKNGGWMKFNTPAFKNQGDCVSYVQSNPNAIGNKSK